MSTVAKLVIAQMGAEAMQLGALQERCRETPRGLVSAFVLALAKAGVLALSSQEGERPPAPSPSP